jgi:hypothetical protein
MSFENGTLTTPSEWPSKSATASPLAKFHSREILSEPVAKRVTLGSNAMLNSISGWLKTAISLPLTTSKSLRCDRSMKLPPAGHLD